MPGSGLYNLSAARLYAVHLPWSADSIQYSPILDSFLSEVVHSLQLLCCAAAAWQPSGLLTERTVSLHSGSSLAAQKAAFIAVDQEQLCEAEPSDSDIEMAQQADPSDERVRSASRTPQDHIDLPLEKQGGDGLHRHVMVWPLLHVRFAVVRLPAGVDPCP